VDRLGRVGARVGRLARPSTILPGDAARVAVHGVVEQALVGLTPRTVGELEVDVEADRAAEKTLTALLGPAC